MRKKLSLQEDTSTESLVRFLRASSAFALLFTSHRPPLSERLEQAKFMKTKRYCKSQVPGSISQTAVLNSFSGLVNLSAGRTIYEMNSAPPF